MDAKTEKQMAKMVDAVQPRCDEHVVAAMTCSHGGSMGSLLISKLLGGAGGLSKSCDLPNPVFVAVGSSTIYAFAYAPKWFSFKIKKEVARWPKAEVRVIFEEGATVCSFVLTTSSGECYPLEVPTVMGGTQLVRAFLEAMGGVPAGGES
jgi:hypothetical protein